MNDIANAFNRIRYASDPNWEPRGHEPIGFDVTAGGDTLKAETPRRYVCDFLKENGREEEADSIQHYDGPVALDQGKLKPGRYDHQPVLDAMQPIQRHLDDWSVQMHAHPHIRIEAEINNDTDEPLPEGHVHVAHAYGQHDSDERAPYADVEHDEVPYDALADHIADIIADHVQYQYSNTWWGQHTDDVDVDNRTERSNHDTLHDLLSQFRQTRPVSPL